MLPAARRIPDGLMVYDYHVDNLMLRADMPVDAGIARVGLLDFQDAMRAPCPFSLGWAVRDDAETIAETLSRADQAMYERRAKARSAT